MKNWENTGKGRYELWVENKEYGKIAVLYDNEIYYEMYKKGDPKFSYSMFFFGQSKHGDIHATNLENAKKQIVQIVLKVYKDMIDIKRNSIAIYEDILGMLS